MDDTWNIDDLLRGPKLWLPMILIATWCLAFLEVSTGTVMLLALAVIHPGFLVFLPLVPAALMDAGVEPWLRWLATGALVWHPWHEQRLGFRGAFNRAVVPENTLGARQGVRGGVLFTRDEWPLSRTMNALQTAGLATIFPVLALRGPWWMLAGIGAFYAGDYLWTHWRQQVPGLWSAVLALLVVCVALWVARPEELAEWDHLRIVASMVAGLAALAGPWWMAYQRVRTS